MDSIDQANRGVKPAVAGAAVFLCTGISVASIFLISPRDIGLFMNWYPGAAILTLISPLLFLCACILVFFRPSFGYGLGGIAGVLALPWFDLTESSVLVSSWYCLNGPAPFPEQVPLARLKILSVALLATAVTYSILRLLPPALLRKAHLSGRTWPAIAVGVVVTFVWLCHSAMPWMLPGAVDVKSSYDLRILHVVKRGLQFHETSVATSRRGQYGVSRCDRRQFQYRFQGLDSGGVMPETTCQRANDLTNSPTLRNLRTAPAIALRSWNAEGWYVVTPRYDILAFTSEYGTSPPREVRDLFEQIEKLPAERTSQPFEIQDVCLGFCYDPVAGLGFIYSNHRCMELPGGITRCF